jgi:hypothetical protein
MSSELTPLDLGNKEPKPIQWSEGVEKGKPKVSETGKESADSSPEESGRAAISATFEKIRSTLSKAIERVSNTVEFSKSTGDLTAAASDVFTGAFSNVYQVANSIAEWFGDPSFKFDKNTMDAKYSALKDKITDGIEGITKRYSKMVEELSDRLDSVDIWGKSMHESLGLSGAKKAQIEVTPEPAVVADVAPAVESIDYPASTSPGEINQALSRLIPGYESSEADLFAELARVKANRIADLNRNEALKRAAELQVDGVNAPAAEQPSTAKNFMSDRFFRLLERGRIDAESAKANPNPNGSAPVNIPETSHPFGSDAEILAKIDLFNERISEMEEALKNQSDSERTTTEEYIKQYESMKRIYTNMLQSQSNIQLRSSLSAETNPEQETNSDIA